ncbi:MAG TPA: hypothetical protein VKU44_09635 [Terriglobia bacterium]|nr:hypothetical protein [Terriglobia bacterium]
MKGFFEWAIQSPLRELGREAIQTLPGLVATVVLVLLGLAIGWVAKQIVFRVLRGLRFDRLCDRLGVSAVIEGLGLARSSSYLAGQAVEGLFVITALLAGLNTLGSPMTHNLVERFFGYLPHMLAALAILVLGALVSRFLGRSALIASVNSHIPSARLFAGLTRFFVLTLAGVAALDELGIGRTTIIVAFSILFGGVVAAVAIAFGLAARDLARDLLQSQFRPQPKQEADDPLRHL